MSFEGEMESEQRTAVAQIFSDQLMACLEECAHGRCGLFSDLEEAPDKDGPPRSWPEAARLRELAIALQAMLAQSGESDPMCEQFLDLCTIHGENDPGEPKLARAFLNQIQNVKH